VIREPKNKMPASLNKTQGRFSLSLFLKSTTIWLKLSWKEQQNPGLGFLGFGAQTRTPALCTSLVVQSLWAWHSTKLNANSLSLSLSVTKSWIRISRVWYSSEPLHFAQVGWCNLCELQRLYYYSAIYFYMHTFWHHPILQGVLDSSLVGTLLPLLYSCFGFLSFLPFL
jgi:hypothetical protein